jgi:hypothetical protein
MDRTKTRSLDILLEQVGTVRAQQVRHFDALDGKRASSSASPERSLPSHRPSKTG